jgi:hypothetical protein
LPEPKSSNLIFAHPLKLPLMYPDHDPLLLPVLLPDLGGFQVLVVDQRIEGRIERRQEVHGFVDLGPKP